MSSVQMILLPRTSNAVAQEPATYPCDVARLDAVHTADERSAFYDAAREVLRSDEFDWPARSVLRDGR